MISDEDRARIEAHVAALDVEAWLPLSTAERDLVRRALAPPDADEHDEHGVA